MWNIHGFSFSFPWVFFAAAHELDVPAHVWTPSVTPYVVSFWLRQSLRHTYVRRVFPYAKQIEETLTQSSYAALRKWGICLRQTGYDKALAENVKRGF